MKKGKQGLSTVVTTLIIILLVLVAVGIIWGVVNNLLGKSTGTIEISTKCLDVDVKARGVIDNGDNTYNVTLYRSPTGEDEVGAKVVFYSAIDNSEPIDFEILLAPLRTATKNLNAGIANATSIEVTPYFLDSKTNKEVLCPTTTSFEFG